MRGQFETETGQAANATFGAYVVQSLGDDVLIGISNDPGNSDGALLVRSADGASFTPERVLDEQGVHDIQVQAGVGWVPGTDPTDDWTFGNLYRRSEAGVWSKLRTLPLTIHALGLWHDGAAIWVAGGMHTGDNATWRGRILKSIDAGATWTAVDVNHYRVYDVIGFSGRLYAVGYEYNGAYSQDLHVSSDDGATWPKVATVKPLLKPRLTVWNGQLIVAGNACLYAVHSDGAVSVHALPFSIVDGWNVLAEGGDGYLYVLSASGVYRSNDFITWHYYCALASAISLARWGTDLLMSEVGLNARIWRVPL